MLEAGEDARFIARRMIVHASEDIGLADPWRLLVATAAAQAVEHVGLPEARLNLAQADDLPGPRARSPTASTRRSAAPRRTRLGAEPVPLHLRDAHYRGARRLGHGKGYSYPHDYPVMGRTGVPPARVRGARATTSRRGGRGQRGLAARQRTRSRPG